MTAKCYVVTVSPDNKLHLSEALDELDAILLEKVCDDEGCPAARMLLTEENEMFIKHQYSGVCLSSDFTMTYYACTPDYCCIFTYMNL